MDEPQDLRHPDADTAIDSGRAALLSAPEAAALLGVKRETLYAYVSRGLLRSHPAPAGGRARFFDADEVARLRARPGPRRATRAGHSLEIASAVTSISAGRLRYRGRDVADLAGRVPFETAAELLWSGSPPGHAPGHAPGPWRPPTDLAMAVATLVAALPEGSGPADRLRAGVVAAAAADPLRTDLRPAAVAGTGRGLLAALAGIAGPVHSRVPGDDRRGVEGGGAGTADGAAGAPGGAVGADLGARGGVADALARSLGLDASWAGLLDIVLVCLADHELATSTLAARVAASTRADPYACVLAGLAAVSGPLHGSASAQVVRLLDEVAAGTSPRRAVAASLRESARLPGFGHALYPRGDPRAVLVLDALRAQRPGGAAWAVVDAVTEAASSRAPTAPNVDWALGSLVFVAGLAPDSGEAMFSLARVAGWLAHVIEEYEAPALRYRVTSVTPGPDAEPLT